MWMPSQRLLEPFAKSFLCPDRRTMVDDFNVFEWANYAKKKARIASIRSKELGLLKAILAASLRPSSHGGP